MFDDQSYYKVLNARADAAFQHEKEQISWIANELKPHKGARESRVRYCKQVAAFLLKCIEIEEKWDTEYITGASGEQLQKDQQELYAEIMPAVYTRSIWNPQYASKMLGPETGSLLSAFAAAMHENIVYAYRHMRFAMHWNQELFLQLFQLLNQDRKVPTEDILALIRDYDHLHAAKKEEVLFHLQYDYQNGTLKDRIESLDWTDPLSVYAMGEYVSEAAKERAARFAAMPEERIAELAETLVQDFRKGFFRGGKDILSKRVVYITYPLGAERLAAKAITRFREEIRYISCIARVHTEAVNPQYNADHGQDFAVLTDAESYRLRLDALKKELEQNEEMMRVCGGSAVIVDAQQAASPWVSETRSQTALTASAEQLEAIEAFGKEKEALLHPYISQATCSYAEIKISEISISENNISDDAAESEMITQEN